MLPVIHLPFGVAVRSYDAMLMLATLVCWVIAPLSAHRLAGIPPLATLRALVLLGVAAFIGGHVHFVAATAPSISSGPLEILRVWNGLHAPGAIAALALAAPWVLRRPGIPPGRFADALVPTIGVGIALARVGCFLNGCCYGTPCQWPWCVSFPALTRVQALSGHASIERVHPLQLYFAATGIGIALVGIWRHRRKRYDGEPALLALLVFSGSAALFEVLRARDELTAYWGPLPKLEWAALALTVSAVTALALAELRHGRRLRTIVSTA